ncbi:hypothetical protein [Streptomyces sp. 2P-4]|uniref:hypothetical protein n=1 Tax=Streptomyces sp. 2P-4 TaxID=2931974 RepID=UPI002541224C|nr:hypothetical protein [Streptomyces sp. 2P-4]
MTRRHTPRPAPAARPHWAGLALHHGTLNTGWCPTCKAETLITTDLLLLAPEGVSAVGTWSWCEICDDPSSPLPPRRIDRGR